MSDDFLSRWSRRKLAAKAGREPEPAPVAPPPPAAPAAAAAAPGQAPAEPVPLPPLESLTPESDFTPFMRSEVDPSTRRQALKTLFTDPQFNVMDGLDVYIDDYSRPDPLPEGWLEKMNQFARLGDYVEPQEERPEAAIDDESAGSAPPSVHPDEVAAVQPERGNAQPDSPSGIEGMTTPKG